MIRLSYLFCLILAATAANGQNKFVDTTELRNYSYLIYGKTRAGCTVQATGVLVISKGQLYLVTACHVINGWFYESYDKDDAYPDTLYLRIYKKKENSVDFIPLDITKLKHTKPAPDWPDIYFYPLNIPAIYRTNTLETLITKYKSAVRQPEEVLVYGYQLTIDSDNVNFATMNVSKVIASWTGQASYFSNLYTYSIGYSDNALGPGDSGSPVYLIYREKAGGTMIQFGGLIVGGVSSLHKATVLKPEIILNLLGSHFHRHKRVKRR